MFTLFGLKNCDTVKKAINHLKANSIHFTFHDFKIEGIDLETLKSWCRQVSWEKLINKKSTTWRSLSPEIQNSIVDEKGAITVIATNPSLIKRPVLVENGKILLIGFVDSEYDRLK